jgi:hypothetical protein
VKYQTSFSVESWTLRRALGCKGATLQSVLQPEHILQPLV